MREVCRRLRELIAAQTGVAPPGVGGRVRTSAEPGLDSAATIQPA